MSNEYDKYSYPRVTVKNGVATVTFTNLESLNALNPEALSELSQLMKAFKQDTTINVIIFTGAGEKAFIAGADIKRMAKMTPEEGWKFAREGQEMFAAMEDLPQVTIAAVNGYALGGGCETALACDLIYASDRAKFGQPEVALGIMTGFGGSVRLPKRIGLGRARELLLTGATISAQQAVDYGLAEAMFPQASLMDEIAKIVATLQSKSPSALEKTKKSLRFSVDHDRDTAMQFEAELFSACFTHPDQKEGTQAFVEKRPPQWGSR